MRRSEKRVIVIAGLICLCILNPVVESTAEEIIGREELQEILRERITVSENEEGKIKILNQFLHATDTIVKYYQGRDHTPVWIDGETLTPMGVDLFNLLENSDQEGFYPEEYHYQPLVFTWMDINSEEDSERIKELLIKMELLLTDAFFLFCSDLYYGRLDAEKLERSWFNPSLSSNLIMALDNVQEMGDIKGIVDEFRPAHQHYRMLLQSFSLYRELQEEGGWPSVPEGDIIQKGDQGEEVELLRQRLQLEPGQNRTLAHTDADLFDEELEKAVYDFQLRCGLEATGRVDEETLKFLNISVEEIIERIIINLERWRWLPRELGDKYVVVNLPDYKLEVIEQDKKVMEMRVIVGREQKQTPILSNRITHLVFSPRWYIPESIALEDYLPKVRQDPDQLKDMKIRVYEGVNGSFRAIDPHDVDWDDVDEDDFNYYFWQDAGPWNTLGRVIIKFPNQYRVYLHDTPDRKLFEDRERTFSAGCIRIENPIQLALYLLQENTDWDLQRIFEVVEEREETIVFLEDTVNIHIQYSTSWIEDNQLNLRADIYQRDLQLKEVYFME